MARRKVQESNYTSKEIQKLIDSRISKLEDDMRNEISEKKVQKSKLSLLISRLLNILSAIVLLIITRL